MVALAKAVKAFKKMTQFLGSVQSENTKAVEQWSAREHSSAATPGAA